MLPHNYEPHKIPLQKYLFVNSDVTNRHYLYVSKSMIQRPVVKFNVDTFSKNNTTFYFCGQNFEMRHEEVLNFDLEGENVKMKIYILDNYNGFWRIEFLPFDDPPNFMYLTNIEVYEDIFRDEERPPTLPTDPVPPPPPPPPEVVKNNNKILLL